MNLTISSIEKLKPYLNEFQFAPSLIFGIETALLDFINGGREIYFDNAFSKGEVQIPINGLIWMGDTAFIRNQAKSLKEKGFDCIKMKVGALDFKNEIEILKDIKAAFRGEKLSLRVDANGAFNEGDAAYKMGELAKLKLHSIEQPVKKGCHDLMMSLIKKNDVPVALDEELIGIFDLKEKRDLLAKLKPPFIILKPSLHGGISGSIEWIEVAESLKIDYWLTSALESNIGLNCIAQFTAEYDITKHHGLGTGSLFTDNIPSPLEVRSGHLYLNI